MGRLDDKVAIVTGGGTGIGEAVAKKLAQEGAKVVVAGLPDDPVEEVVKEIRSHGGEAAGYLGNVAEVEHARACVQKAIDEFGKLDVLVNNAGTFQTTGETQDFPVESYDYMTRMNTRSVFLMTKFALPHLHKTRGNVISTGSEAGLLGQPECTTYGGTKAWIHAFMRGVALEQAKYGIRANCVCPGPIDTQWHEVDESPMTQEMEQNILKATPLGRRGTPEEAANIFAVLASDEASFVTGALYFVDGGISISRGPIGEQVPNTLREQPEGRLDLAHSKEGLEGKKIQRVE
ncbi:MAG: SDR family oxidoreductase [Chloroflexota bacterium]|nr:SDR family oxidoreductase [Chloroflexota bacterium]